MVITAPPARAKNEKSSSDEYQHRQARNRIIAILFFLVPGMFFFFVFELIPVSKSLYYSVFRWNGLGPPTDYVGFKNYDFLLNQKVFRQSIQNSFVIVVLCLSVQLPMALGLALLVGRGNLPGRSIFCTILFIPYVFSEILTGYIWSFIYHPRDGLANFILHLFAPGVENIPWLADKDIALFAIFAVMTWKHFGFHMILYLAALQNVPSDLEEAARIDGANERQVIRHVTLPLIGPTIRLAVYLSVLGSFQQFVLIWVMTKGGPANSTQVLATYLFKFGIESWRLGLGSAIAVVLFVITISFSLVYQVLVLRRDYSTEFVH